jgi:hypothetical protein
MNNGRLSAALHAAHGCFVLLPLLVLLVRLVGLVAEVGGAGTDCGADLCFFIYFNDF